jgi:hypothetical protein
MDLMDLALKFKDYEWVKELVRQMEQPESPQRDSNENASIGVYIKEGIALEDIFNTYAVKENAGIRSFNINSEFDRNNSELVLVEKISYKKGEQVRYKIPTINELTYIRGMVNGYMMGYKESQKIINNQMIQFYNSVTAQIPKTQSTTKGKLKKDQKKKEAS